MSETREPQGAANPIAYKVPGKYLVAKYAPGIRMPTTEMML